ncbi:hypothetical protein CW749_16795 [Vibrio sp. vnigr-6D03]|uniref:hypothetical protein n=1 Tax=Vibrio sp. vnigr-6D03 TaxID=2058088 RepID=UPI000C324015|nr:hypothetical protein [Vibrio sp. vnigr-6D03]PKF78724.1 hypothetical protein CW749_16795 [Vibrio sp. vnigr-6D03]
MKRSRRISAVMHKLLIEHSLDGFTVLEARDLWLSVDDKKCNSSEARKKVYRAIFNFEKKNWLRCEGSGRNKRYFQTEQFRKQPSYAALNHQSGINHENTNQDYSVLIKERNEYKGELEILLGEVDEYQSIISRFPELESRLAPIHQQAKERGAMLLGKLNALTTVLNTLSTGG